MHRAESHWRSLHRHPSVDIGLGSKKRGAGDAEV